MVRGRSLPLALIAMDFLYIVAVLLFSIVVHEVAHAWQALREGDTTARDLGRITLNPLPHLDLVGSLIVPLALYLLPGNFVFGWAKPVPVNPANYRNYRAGDIRVSMAGIVANLCLAALCAGLLAVFFQLGGAWWTTNAFGSALVKVATVGVFVNLVLAWFNLLPVPPLDGSHVFRHLLPARLAELYQSVGRFGIGLLVLVGVFYRDALFVVFAPVELAFDWIMRIVLG